MLYRAPRLLVAAMLCLGFCAASEGQKPQFKSVDIRNDKPRTDVHGRIVDAHDGCLQFFNGRYYLYGTAYGHTAGYSINNRFRVYSSPDMVSWTYEGELLKSPPDGVYYRPYVVYNNHTKKYVLWYNWYPKLWNGKVGVATSDSPVGPFTIQNEQVHLSQAAYHPGDGSLFVDHDDSAYFIYTVIDKNHSIRVEKLTDDYLASAGQVSSVVGWNCEAPSMFRNGQYYYLLFDRTCCFCEKGSGARVYKSDSPMGPFAGISNINLDLYHNKIINAQQTYVAEIPTPQGTEYMWMGDRWNSRTDGVKGHDFQYWIPLRFEKDGTILPLEQKDSWSLSLREGSATIPPLAPYAWPKKPDPDPLVVDACYQKQLSAIESGREISEEDRDDSSTSYVNMEVPATARLAGVLGSIINLLH